MSSLCCCRPRRKDKHDSGPDTGQGNVGYYQERSRPISKAAAQELDTNAGTSSEGPAQIKTKEVPFAKPAQLNDLVVDDGDSDDGDDAQPHLTRRASAALGAVRARFNRHLSSESDVKSQSTASVGKSQEEIARRAELRRLRHKRIQDELKHDLRGEHITDQTSNTSVKSVRRTSLTSPSQSQPGGGPRDTIEFTVLDGNQVSPKSRSQAPSLACGELPHQDTRLSEQSSGIGPHSCIVDSSTQQNKVAVATHADPEPSKPTSQPLPHSETRSTFRLSSSPSWLDRIIGVDNTFSETAEHPSLDGRSALSIWLATQGLQRDSPTEHLGLDKTIYGAAKKPGSKDIKHPDDISISISEVSRRSEDSKAEPRESRDVFSARKSFLGPSQERLRGHILEPTSTTDEGPQQITQSPSEDLALDYVAALAFTSPNDHTSSQYASRAQSFQPSPSRSRLNLHHLNAKDLQDLQLSPFQWHDNASVQRQVGRSEAQSSYATAKDHVSTCDLPIQPSPVARTVDSDVADGTSFCQFETASFQIREAELQTIEKRFADVLSRRKPTPFQSRFIEDFGDVAESSKKKASLIPRLIHLRMPVKAKRDAKNNPSSDIEQMSSPSFGPGVAQDPGIGSQRALSTSCKQPRSTPPRKDTFPRPGLKESATDLWQRAIRQEAEQRRGTSSKSGQSSRPTPSQSKSSLRPKKREDSSLQVQTESTRSGQFLEVPSMRRTPSESRWRLPKWNTPDIKERWPKLPMALPLAPESWARYPAHDREERNANARSSDNVKSYDFAIRSVSSEGHMGWTTDLNVSKDDNIGNRRTVSMHEKLGKAVKSGISKLLPFTESVGEARSNSLGRRRGSFQLAGEVEYPELEVLPPGIGHIMEPEQVAAAIPSRQRSHTGSSRHSFGRQSLANIVRRRPSAMSSKPYDRQITGFVPSEIRMPAKSVEVLPTTPLKVLGHEDKHLTPRTDVFVTPLSTSLMPDSTHKEAPGSYRLPVAKSEQQLPFYKVYPGDGEEMGWTRSFTWSGPLSPIQTPSNLYLRGHHELQVLRRPGDLNASKDSFATGASFATAAAE